LLSKSIYWRKNALVSNNEILPSAFFDIIQSVLSTKVIRGTAEAKKSENIGTRSKLLLKMVECKWSSWIFK
jgi:hypothetical protein